MKIGMTYFEFGGQKGIARVASELTSRMSLWGHDVHFHCVNALKHGSESRITFHNVHAANSFNTFGLVSFAFGGKRSLQKDSYDITHTHGNIIGSDVITAHSCHQAAMMSARLYADRNIRSSRNLGVADAFRLFLERKNYSERRFKKVVAVSEGVKKELIEFYSLTNGDICVIPNGVDLAWFTPALRQTRGRQLRLKLGIEPDETVVIFVGNEFGRKGLQFAIEALSLLKAMNTRLLVLGSDVRKKYEQLSDRHGVRNRILFAGSVENVNEYYAASDVFLLPTHYEAFSLATLEAAASGIPLLVTKVNGTEELLDDGVNGFFVERNAESIAEKIDRVVRDRSSRDQLAFGARKSAEAYSWDSITQRTLDVYRQIL